mmetsp:Transcript_8346/g.26944  ORF Transcript_8346/g.26944 Transcript_8346/m.26944 type:complete len:309 (+) Transcript_8346:482-1408(+)
MSSGRCTRARWWSPSGPTTPGTASLSRRSSLATSPTQRRASTTARTASGRTATGGRGAGWRRSPSLSARRSSSATRHTTTCGLTRLQAHVATTGSTLGSTLQEELAPEAEGKEPASLVTRERTGRPCVGRVPRRVRPQGRPAAGGPRARRRVRERRRPRLHRRVGWLPPPAAQRRQVVPLVLRRRPLRQRADARRHCRRAGPSCAERPLHVRRRRPARPLPLCLPALRKQIRPLPGLLRPARVRLRPSQSACGGRKPGNADVRLLVYRSRPAVPRTAGRAERVRRPRPRRHVLLRREPRARALLQGVV